jgi:hypothetical protein
MGEAAADGLQLGRWVDRWRAALGASQAHGQRDDTAWGAGRVLVGSPASAEEVAAIERSSGLPMPESVRRLFLAVRSVEAVWHFADDVEPPGEFRGIFAGDCSWSLDRVPAEIEDYREWVSVAFPEADDPYCSVWHGKYPLLHVGNDDRIALDGDGRVVYLSHDEGEGHGYVLGRDVFEFLDAWTRLGCPGPEDWQWLPFVAAAGEGLDPDSESGLAWRAWFGIP